VKRSDAPVVKFPQHIMNKLNLKMGREPTFEISCTLNIPQKIDDVWYNYNVMNKLLS
jgi:antitoxin component of MazEF toxin-antitoxin module